MVLQAVVKEKADRERRSQYAEAVTKVSRWWKFNKARQRQQETQGVRWEAFFRTYCVQFDDARSKGAYQLVEFEKVVEDGLRAEIPLVLALQLFNNWNDAVDDLTCTCRLPTCNPVHACFRVSSPLFAM